MKEERDDGLDDQLMDWGLGERLGGEAPPDLRAAVRERVAAAPVAEGVGMRQVPAGPRWLAAAVVLLGVTAVFGVALWPRGTEAPVPAAPAVGQEPRPTPVTSVADVAALPADARAVEAIGVGDDVVEALTRLRDLEVLVVREPWNESFGLGLKVTGPTAPRHVTNTAWRHFAKFSKLRRLELSGTVLVARVDSGDGASVVAALESLPLLESLTMRCLDSANAVVQRLAGLRNLRQLDLSFNHGFTEEGIAALLQCRSLRKLSLRGCQQLHGPWLGRLGALPELEELDLGRIDGMNWRHGAAEPDDREGQLLRQQARGWADSLQAGVEDQAITGLARAPRLRVLDLGGGRWSDTGLGPLGECATLRELDLTGGREHGSAFVSSLPKGLERLVVCGAYTDAFCAEVRQHLPNLRHLTVAACDQITDRGLADLLAMPSLRVLDLRQMRGLTVASIDHLAQAQQLVELDLRHDDFVKARHVLRLQRCLPKLATLRTSVPDLELKAAVEPPEPWQIHSVDQARQLPEDVRHVIGRDLDDECLPVLARLPALEVLELVSSRGPGVRNMGGVSITDAGLGQLGTMHRLRRLVLTGQHALAWSEPDVFGSLPDLEELHLQEMVVPDAAFAPLAKGRLRVLSVVHCHGFGRAAIETLAQLPSLREVSLRGCAHVEEQWLVLLAALPDLQVLDLSMIGSRTVFSGLWALPPPEPGSGVTDMVLQALGRATRLRSLNLAQAGITGGGLRHLQGLPALRSLDLTGTDVAAADLQWLPAGLEQLGLQAVPRLAGDLGEVLAAATPRLHTLDLSNNHKLGDDCLEPLRAVRSLRGLDLSHCSKFTVDAVHGLCAMTWLESLKLRGWTAFDTEQWAKVRQMPNLRRLETDKVSETLR